MKTVFVSEHQYDQTIRGYAAQGLHVTGEGYGWVVLERPKAYPKSSNLGRFLLLTVFTVGLYPLLILMYWMFVAWWAKPIMAASRVDRVTIQIKSTHHNASYGA